MQFNVQLALQPTTIDQLPANVQSQIATQVENLGPDMISIQQLWLDLNTAARPTSKAWRACRSSPLTSWRRCCRPSWHNSSSRRP
jgi:hypothetical protein